MTATQSLERSSSSASQPPAAKLRSDTRKGQAAARAPAKSRWVAPNAVSDAEAFQILDAGWLQTLVVHDTQHFDAGMDCLTALIEASLHQDDPEHWIHGLVVLPQGKSFAFPQIFSKKRALANQRITVLNSDLTDTLAGARQLQQEILQHHAEIAAHAQRVRSQVSPARR